VARETSLQIGGGIQKTNQLPVAKGNLKGQREKQSEDAVKNISGDAVRTHLREELRKGCAKRKVHRKNLTAQETLPQKTGTRAYSKRFPVKRGLAV